MQVAEEAKRRAEAEKEGRGPKKLTQDTEKRTEGESKRKSEVEASLKKERDGQKKAKDDLKRKLRHGRRPKRCLVA